MIVTRTKATVHDDSDEDESNMDFQVIDLFCMVNDREDGANSFEG